MSKLSENEPNLHSTHFIFW